jgi:threonine synthase
MKTLTKPFTFATILKCSNCQEEYPLSSINTYAVCCNQPLIVEYDYSLGFLKETLQFRQNNMWRYSEMLPVIKEDNIVTLGEGMTPLFTLNKLADRYGFSDLLLKDESFNPTGSFKARGLSLAVSKAKEFGITHWHNCNSRKCRWCPGRLLCKS